MGEGLDRAGLEALYLRLEKPLYNVVYRWLWQRDDAAEVVQEAFVRLWTMRARVDLERVEPLVYRIALNLAASRRRGRRLWRWLSLEALGEPSSAHPDAVELAADTQQRERLRRAVEALPEGLRRVVMLCELSELSYAEVAEALGIPAGTVGSRRHRALELLRRKLSEEERAHERARRTSVS